jgi:hypothetical protein
MITLDEKNSMKKIIITNSHYSYLWDIINDYDDDNILLCADTLNNYKFKHDTFIYDSTLNYVRRLIQILSNIDDEFIMLFSDVDILLNINKDVVDCYKNMMIDNNLDRISFGVFNKNKDVIEKNGLLITSINNVEDNHFFTPYDYTPSIYRRSALLQLCQSFPDETYPTFETNENVQNYVNEHFKFYAIQKSDKINLVYHRGFVYSSDLLSLHITVKGKLLNFDYYYDLKEKLLEIISKYNLKLEMTEEQRFISKNEI